MAFYADVAEDFKQLYENEEDYNVKIYAGEELKELHAHSLVLRTRSPYFRGALSYEWTKKQDGYFIFKKSNISASTFETILKFIYCGVIDLRELDGTEVFKVLVAADELGLQRLIDHVQKFLIENRDSFLREDPVRMLCIVTSHETFNDLKDFCLEAILADPDILFGSEKFLALEESTLILILKSDKLTMDEIEVWDHTIKWGIAQIPELKSDIKNFKNQDFKALKKKLCNLIPLIRFHEIPMEDFYTRVWPFKKILSDELVDDILRCYMVPKADPHYNVYPSRLAISSTLINGKHLTLFAAWIDNKAKDYESLNQVPYEFQLLYRASKDGNNANEFHQKCDNQGATIAVCKVQNSNMLVGGYNPSNWYNNGQYQYANNSFIFSIKNCDDPKNSHNLGRTNNHNYSINYNSSYGPTFGSGHDLQCCFNVWYANPNSYTNIGLPNQFNVTDWEVFKIVKKK